MTEETPKLEPEVAQDFDDFEHSTFYQDIQRKKRALAPDVVPRAMKWMRQTEPFEELVCTGELRKGVTCNRVIPIWRPRPEGETLECFHCHTSWVHINGVWEQGEKVPPKEIFVCKEHGGCSNSFPINSDNGNGAERQCFGCDRLYRKEDGVWNVVLPPDQLTIGDAPVKHTDKTLKVLLAA